MIVLAEIPDYLHRRMDMIIPDLYQGCFEDGIEVAKGKKTPDGKPFAGIVNLAGPMEPYAKEHQTYPNPTDIPILYVPVADGICGLGVHFPDITAFVWDRLVFGKPVLLHCWAGVSRTTAATAACLISGGWTMEDALAHISKQRPVAKMNECFIDELKEWAWRDDSGDW